MSASQNLRPVDSGSPALAGCDSQAGAYPALADAERNLVLVQWNATRMDYPADKCIHELFEAQVERTPDAIAVIFEKKRRQSATYGELNRRRINWRMSYSAWVLGPETLAGICLKRSERMLVAILAA